jgi:autotransporter-associated beta strand protein
MVLTFQGTGEDITISGAKDFDTLIFTANGYTFSGGGLNINPADSSTVAKINVQDGVTATISATITGSDKLQKVGPGTLTLESSASSYSGGTEVTAGVLNLNNGTIPNGTFTLSSGATLTGTGTVTGPATANGTLAPGQSESPGTLSFASGLTLTSTSSSVFDLLGVGTPGINYDQIKVTGGALVLGGSLAVTAASSGRYILFDYTGATYSGDIKTAFSSVSTILVGQAAQSTLDSSASRITLTIKTDDQTTVIWEGTGTNSVLSPGHNGWKDGADGPDGQDGLVITFSGEGERVTIQTGNNLDALPFDTLNFTSDDFILTGGDLEIAPATSQGSVGTINVASNVATEIQNNITGSGQTLKKEGDGILELTGTNSYDGGTVVAAGTLKGDTQSLQGDIVNNSTLIFEQNTNGEYSGNLSGSGSIVKEGSGTLELSGENVSRGVTEVRQGSIVTLEDNSLSQGAVILNSGSSISLGSTSQSIGGLSGQGNVNLGSGALTVTQASASTTETFAGIVSGTGSLTKKGAGTLVLTGNNDYNGGTLVEAGVLEGNTNSLIGDVVNNATVVFNQISSGTYSGSMTGEGGITKEGGGSLTLTGKNEHRGENLILEGEVVAADDLTLGSGSYHLEEEGSLSLGDTDQQISGLTGAGSVSLGKGTLEVHVAPESIDVFDGSLRGQGNILKGGYGTLVINDAAATLNDLNINLGSFIIGGSADDKSAKLTLSPSETFDVYGGAVLGGHGTLVSNVIIHEGGAISPGNSYGFYTIEGDLTFEPGSYFIVEVDPEDPQGGDRTIVTGLATLAGTVSHVSSLQYDVYDYSNPSKEWLILDAGTMAGTFDAAQSDLAFLVPNLRYDDIEADVYLSFSISSGISEGEITGTTTNQNQVIKAITSLPSDSSLFSDIVNNTTNENLGQVLDGLSGEIFASMPAALQTLSFASTRDILRHAAESFRSFESGGLAVAAGEGVGNSLWVTVADAYSSFDSTSWSGKTTFTGFEISGGYDFFLPEGYVGGLAIFFADKELEVEARDSNMDVKSMGLSAYFGKTTELSGKDLRFVLGGGFTRHDLDGERIIPLGAATQTLKSTYNANSWQIFFEGSLSIPVGERAFMEPFAVLGWTGVKVAEFSETGGNAALNSAAKTQHNIFSLIGFRLFAKLSEKFSLKSELSWRHVYGRLEDDNVANFLEGGDRFTVRGASGNGDALTAGLSGTLHLSDQMSLSLNYDGAYGSKGMSHAGSATLSFDW